MTRKLLQATVLTSLALVAGFTTRSIDAKTWSLEPESPRWGETLRFEWTPEASPVEAEPSELPRVLVRAIDEDGQTRWLVADVRWQDGRGVAELVVPEGLAHLNFSTTDSPTIRHLRSRRVHHTDGRPARGAWEQHLWNAAPSEADSIVAKELANYPNNYSVYRALWWMKSITERDTFPSEAVRRQIEELERLDQRTDEWLYAMASGRVLIGERERAFALIHELAERFPASPLVARVFNDYDYRLLELGFGSEPARAFWDFRLAHLERHPEMPGGGEMLFGMIQGAGEREIPLATAQRALGAWLREQPSHPLPHLGLARLHRAQDQQLDRGLEEALRAAELLLQGNLFQYGDLDGELASFFTPMAYLEAAQLARDLGRRSEALAFAALAQELEVERTPQPHELEGELWRSLDRPDRAEAAYQAAWRLGSTRAEGELAQLFEAREGSRDRFERYLRSVQERDIEGAGANGGLEPAPDFAVEALDGTSYALDRLRGKVVVLNFWGTGCLPCRAEVPDLNELVQRFEGRGVVFLAPTGDSAEGLESFLEELPFDYEIVPDSRQLFADYQVSGIPVHVVIDRQGRLMLRRTGASENLTHELAQVIERAL